MDNKDIKILEAILFASGEPLEENDLKEKINDKNNISKHLQKIKDFSELDIPLCDQDLLSSYLEY